MEDTVFCTLQNPITAHAAGTRTRCKAPVAGEIKMDMSILSQPGGLALGLFENTSVEAIMIAFNGWRAKPHSVLFPVRQCFNYVGGRGFPLCVDFRWWCQRVHT